MMGQQQLNYFEAKIHLKTDGRRIYSGLTADADIETLSHVTPSMVAYQVLILKKPVDRAFLLALIDGVLDVQVITCRKTSAPALVPKVIKGTHLSDPAVRRLSAAEFSIETDPSWPVECDGEPVGNTTVKGRVVPAAISLKI